MRKMSLLKTLVFTPLGRPFMDGSDMIFFAFSLDNGYVLHIGVPDIEMAVPGKPVRASVFIVKMGEDLSDMREFHCLGMFRTHEDALKAIAKKGIKIRKVSKQWAFQS